MSRIPIEPFVPRTFSCAVSKKTSTKTSVDARTGERQSRSVDVWDVRGRANGRQWAKRFNRAGLAHSCKDRLDREFALGLKFDRQARCFIMPEAPEVPEGSRPPTVFELTERFFWLHPEWEPKTKVLAAYSFNRAQRWLLVPGAIPEGPDLEAVETYQKSASFLPPHLGVQLTPTQASGNE